MTIIIDAPAEIEAAITEKAEQAGLSVSEFFLRAAIERVAVNDSIIVDQDANAQEQVRQEALAWIEAKRAAGAFTGLSVDGFLAERREQVKSEVDCVGTLPTSRLARSSLREEPDVSMRLLQVS